MSRVSTYLHFPRDAEAAFTFYRSVFGTEFNGPIHRFKDMPMPGAPPVSPEDQHLVMHVALPILGGHVIMGCDVADGQRPACTPGTNVYINLETDTRAEADDLYAALIEGGEAQRPLAEMPWGYFGCLRDRFGVQWMFHCAA